MDVADGDCTSAECLTFALARQALLLLQALRGVMVAALISFVPTHVAFVRSDSVSIVLDAIAAMFMLQVCVDR